MNCFSTEENCVIRTPEVHASHLAAIDKDESCKRTYGVQGKCVFADLTYVSVVESLPPDAMHDIMEGLCAINVKIVLQYLIRHKKLTAKTSNDRLDWFAFAKCDAATKPTHLPDDFASRGRIIGSANSASQNWCLFRNLPFVVGDCVTVTEDDIPDFWRLHLLAREIFKIVFAPVVRKEWLIELQQYVFEHHTLLQEVDSNAFTPKLHFLVHYPRLMEWYGPLKHLWCMRFEACHPYYKTIAKMCNNYKNIALTLSERHQFKARWLMSGENALAADVVISGKQSTVNVASLPRQLQQQLDEAFVVEPVDTVLSVVSVQLQTTQLCVNELYVVEISPHDEVLMFVFVTHIIKHDGTWIVCGLLSIAERYSNVSDSYIVDYIVLSVDELKTYGPVAHVRMEGKTHVYLTYRLVG